MLVPALLLAVLLQSSPGGTAGRAGDSEAVLAILRRADDGRTDAAALGAELARLGPASLPRMFSILAFGPAPDAPLSTMQQEGLLEALAAFGRPPVRAFLERRLNGKLAAEERLALLDVTARMGTSEDMPLVRRAAEAGSTAGLEDSLQAAVAGILGRDPRGVVFVSFWAPNATLEVATALVLGCGKSGQPEALPTLADLLDGRSELAPVLLQEIGILATIAPKPIAADVLDPVRRILEENEGPLLREAAIALGRAQDPAAAGRLIELLGHEDRGVRSAAEWALEALSSLRFGSNAERWSAWLRGETQWLREDAARMRREIQSPTPEVALRALSEMCRHRLRRHELALVGTPALAHHDPLVRRLACLALAQLGSTAAVPALRMTLADGDAEVVDAARRALATLEG